MHLPEKTIENYYYSACFHAYADCFLQMKSLLLQPIGLKIQLHTTGKLMQCRT